MSDKKILREKYKNERKKLKENEVIEKSLIIQKNFLDSFLYNENKKICIYMDFNNEVKTNLIIEKALIDKKEVYIPKVHNDIINFYKIDKETKYYVNKFGIKEPNLNSKKFQNDCFPNVFIVPGIAFSNEGSRIGYGGGYYDKWIEENSNNIYIGFSYDFQMIDNFTLEKHDKKMDYIITEKGIIDCKKT